jgi:all-trans-retinol 13,14-reductase
LLFIFFAVLFLYKKLTEQKHPFTPKKITKVETDVDICKRLYSTKEGVIPSDLDAIVIGSGIGGLTLAAMLAKQGRRVLILEQHDIAGGCCHTFEENGFEFESGWHVVFEMDLKKDKGFMGEILHYLTDGQLKWEPYDDPMDEIRLGTRRTISVPRGKENFIKELKKQFPDEAEKLDKFFDLVQKISDDFYHRMVSRILPPWLGKIYYYFFGGYYRKYAQRTLSDVLKNEFGFSKDCVSALSYFYGYLGSSPDSVYFSIFSLVFIMILKGNYFPVGGPQNVVRKLLEQVEARGGKCLVKCQVEKILIKGNKAVGVKTSKGQKIYAPLIVSDAGFMNTYIKLVGEESLKKFGLYDRVKSMKQSDSNHIMLFLGFDKSSKELQLPKRNFFLMPDSDFSEAARLLKEEMRIDQLRAMVGFPSSKDPEYEKRCPGKSTAVICSGGANMEWFKEWEHKRVKQRGKDYEQFKQKFVNELEQRFFTHFPHLKQHCVYKEGATPLTTQYYLASVEGASYGLEYNEEKRDWIRADTPIENLYLTGQDVISPGLAGAIGGALICYAAITGENVLAAAKKYCEQE